MTEKVLHPEKEKSIFDMTTDEITQRVQEGIKDSVDNPPPKTPPVTYLDPETGKLVTK